MKKTLLALLLVITAKASFAIPISDMPGYANDISVLASSATTTGVFSYSPGSTSAGASLTDGLASSWAFSNSNSAYIDLSFGTSIYDSTGIDLSIFFVGAPPHSTSLSLLSGSTSTKAKTFSTISYTGFCVDNDGNGSCGGAVDDPIYVMDIDFDIYHMFDPIDSIRIDISKGSAVPSLVGAHHTSAVSLPEPALPLPATVPLPLPIWLFSSGLALFGFVARKKSD
jgi:hypothetical protein